ncbi:hypothetical protein AB4K20DRAFT_1882615 [Rhizopus microsporus]
MRHWYHILLCLIRRAPLTQTTPFTQVSLRKIIFFLLPSDVSMAIPFKPFIVLPVGQSNGVIFLCTVAVMLDSAFFHGKLLYKALFIL